MSCPCTEPVFNLHLAHWCETAITNESLAVTIQPYISHIVTLHKIPHSILHSPALSLSSLLVCFK